MAHNAGPTYAKSSDHTSQGHDAKQLGHVIQSVHML